MTRGIIIGLLLLAISPLRAQQVTRAFPKRQQMLEKMPDSERARVKRAYARLNDADRSRADEVLASWYEGVQASEGFSHAGAPAGKFAKVGGGTGLAVGAAATAAGYATALGLRVAADAPRYLPLLFKGMTQNRLIDFRVGAYRASLKVVDVSTRYLLPATVVLAVAGAGMMALTAVSQFKEMEREQRIQNQAALGSAVAFIEGMAQARRGTAAPADDPGEPFSTLRDSSAP
jgi:hypothetical protein